VETKLTESSFHVPENANREQPGGQDYCGPHRRPNDERRYGLFGLEKEKLFDVVLIPGLKVKVDGSSDNQGRVVAKTITVDGDRQARGRSAGVHPVRYRISQGK
jgi:hypothetical protein